MDILSGGLGIGKLEVLIKKNFLAVHFFSFLSSKPWIRVWIGSQPNMLDPDLYQTNTDPKHCMKEMAGAWEH
jgi:hypothetical protein